MNLPPRNTLTLLLDEKPLIVAEPTVAHIEALIAVEEKYTGESISAIARRSVAQFTALCCPRPPKGWHLGEWFAYWKERRRIQGFVLGLTYQQLSVALSGLLAAAHGMDVEEYIKAINESEKKKQRTRRTNKPRDTPLGEYRKLIFAVATAQHQQPDTIRMMLSYEFIALAEFIARERKDDAEFRAALAGCKLK